MSFVSWLSKISFFQTCPPCFMLSFPAADYHEPLIPSIHRPASGKRYKLIFPKECLSIPFIHFLFHLLCRFILKLAVTQDFLYHPVIVLLVSVIRKRIVICIFVRLQYRNDMIVLLLSLYRSKRKDGMFLKKCFLSEILQIAKLPSPVDVVTVNDKIVTVCLTADI